MSELTSKERRKRRKKEEKGTRQGRTKDYSSSLFLFFFEHSSNSFVSAFPNVLLFLAVCTCPNATLTVLNCCSTTYSLSALNFKTQKSQPRAPLPFRTTHSTTIVMSQWNISDRHKRICLFPMPRIPRLGPKARDAGVYVSGALVKSLKRIQLQTC